MNARQRFNVNLPNVQGAQMVNASLTGFRLVFTQDQVKLGKSGTIAIALALPGGEPVKVRARIVWVHFGLKTAGFEIVEQHEAYAAYIRSLEQAA